MAVTNAQIVEFLLANPGMSDADIASVMNTYGIDPSQVAEATGSSVADIQTRFDAVATPEPVDEPLVTPRYEEYVAPAAPVAPVAPAAVAETPVVGAVTTAQIVEFLTKNPELSDSAIVKVMETYKISPAQLATAVGLPAATIEERVAATLPPDQTIQLGETVVQSQTITQGQGEDQQIVLRPAAPVAEETTPTAKANAAYTAENVDKLAAQILAQNTSSAWQGGLPPEKAARYMADDLAKSGITDITQVGKGEDGIINKVTGEKLVSGYGERTKGDLWSGSYEGKGNTGFGVKFDDSGNPIFYTEGASSSTLKKDLLKLAVVGGAIAGLGGFEGLLGGAGAAGSAAGLTAAEAAGLGLTATEAAGLGLSATEFAAAGGAAAGGGLLTPAAAATTPAVAGTGIKVGTALAGTGVLTGSALGTSAAATGASTLLGPAAAAVGTGLLTSAGTKVAESLVGKAVGAGLTTAGGLVQAQMSKEAAQAAQKKIDDETAAAKTAAQFKPIGMTTRFGSSQFAFDPKTGQLTSAGYTLSPEAKAAQDRFVKLAESGLTQAEGAQKAFEPLQTGAQSLFSLGNKYLAQTPEQVASDYLKSQMALLQPGRELELANLQNKLQQQGRGGLSVAQGGSLGATTPELQALFNARAQQEAILAANAQQAGQQNVLFGAGLLGTGATTMGNYYGGQQAAYSPYTTAMNQVQGLETAGQQPLTTGINLGNLVSTAGARQGELGLRGAGQSVALATGAAATNSPLATGLTALGSSGLLSTGIDMFGKAIGNRLDDPFNELVSSVVVPTNQAAPTGPMNVNTADLARGLGIKLPTNYAGTTTTVDAPLFNQKYVY